MNTQRTTDNERDERIRNETATTLASLDETPKMKASPWFAQRLQQRLEQTEQRNTKPQPSRFVRLALQPALVVAFCVANILTALPFIFPSAAEDTRISSLNAFGAEYALKVQLHAEQPEGF